MKKFEFKKAAVILTVAIALLVVLAMALLIYVPAFTAYADSEEEMITIVGCYRIVPKDLEHNATAGVSNIPVYDSNADNGHILFYLPESYYITNVKLQHKTFGNQAIDYYTFSYMGFDYNMEYYSPYIDVSFDLTPVESVTFFANENPFPDVRLTLKEEVNGVPSIDATHNLTNDYTIYFIGFDETGEDFYISATKDGETKYTMVNKEFFTNNSIPYQARTQAEREALLKEIASTPKAGDIVPNTSKTLRIILIIGICIPAVLIVVLLFKPAKGSRSNGVAKERSHGEFDYDERRSYRRDDRDYQDRDDKYRDDRRDDRYRDDRRDDREYKDDRDYNRPRDDRRY